MRLNKNGIPILDNIKNPVPIGSSLRDSIFKKTKGLCFYCGRKLQNENYKAKNYMTIDHVEPKMNGGTNNIHNLVPSCQQCNVMKGHDDINCFIKRIQEMPKNKFQFKKKLSIGEVLKINGIPVKYLGDGMIGSNTDWEKEVTGETDTETKNHCS